MKLNPALHLSGLISQSVIFLLSLLHEGSLYNYTITQWGLKIHNYTMGAEFTQLHYGGWNYTITQWGLNLHNYTIGAEFTQLHNGGWIYTITQWGLDLPITKWGLNLHNYTMGAAKFTQFNEGWNYTIAQWGLKLHNCTMGAEIIYLAYSIYEYVLVYSVNKYTFSVQFKRLRI